MTGFAKDVCDAGALGAVGALRIAVNDAFRLNWHAGVEKTIHARTCAGDPLTGR